jgi:iron(III) transport system permease protein
LILGHAGRFLPVALLALLDGWRRQDPLLWEAARAAPVAPWRRWSRVTVPLFLPSLAAATGLAAALSLGEIGAALLLVPPGGQTVALRLYNLLHYGADSRVASLALAAALSAGAAGTLVWALVRWGRR